MTHYHIIIVKIYFLINFPVNFLTLHNFTSIMWIYQNWRVVIVHYNSVGYCIFVRCEYCTLIMHGIKAWMGPLLVLVSPCFRETVVVTCKIGSFLCSLDNLLQKNVIVFFFENQISKWRSFEKKRAIFDLLFTFFSYQGKVTKIPSAHISLTYIHVFCSPYWLFLPYQFWKKNTNLSGMVSLWYESWCWFLFAPFWNNQ